MKINIKKSEFLLMIMVRLNNLGFSETREHVQDLDFFGKRILPNNLRLQQRIIFSKTVDYRWSMG